MKRKHFFLKPSNSMCISVAQYFFKILVVNFVYCTVPRKNFFDKQVNSIDIYNNLYWDLNPTCKAMYLIAMKTYWRMISTKCCCVNDLSNKFAHADLKKNNNYWTTVVMLKSVLYIYELRFLKLSYNLTVSTFYIFQWLIHLYRSYAFVH